jgi:hypothetical protein
MALTKIVDPHSGTCYFDYSLISLSLDFGHLGMEPLSIRRGLAGAVQKFGEVWWGGRHHEIP